MTNSTTETRFFIPCGCVGGCTILGIDRFQFEGDDEWWFEFYTRVGEKSSFWYRAKVAWKVLWGQNHYLDSLCWNNEEIQQLRDFIDTKKEVYGP